MKRLHKRIHLLRLTCGVGSILRICNLQLDIEIDEFLLRYRRLLRAGRDQ